MIHDMAERALQKKLRPFRNFKLGKLYWIFQLGPIYSHEPQSSFDARYWMLGASALGRPRGMVWGGRREGGSGWGTRADSC